MAVLNGSVTSAMAEQVSRVNGNGRIHAPTRPPAKVDEGKYELLISLIKADGGTQTRVELNDDTVSDYATDMDHGDLFPPVVVFYDGTSYWLADGFHRLAAVKRLGHRNIWSEVRQGTRRDAVLYSVGANAHHGLRRTNEDKKRAVHMLLRDDEWKQLSSREIGRLCRVSHQFVVEQRDALSTVDTFGKEYNRDVVKAVKKLHITEPETVDMIADWHKNGRETFNEVVASGYIQPGDEEDAVPITAAPGEIKKAMRKKIESHRIIGAQAAALDYSFSIEELDGVFVAYMSLGEFTSHAAAEKAITKVKKLMEKCA